MNRKSTKPTSENFSFSSSPMFSDKDELIDKGLLFDIKGIEFQPGRGFEGSDRWAVTIAIADRPDEIVTLGSNAKRDSELKAAQHALASCGVIRGVRLKKNGKAYYFETVIQRPKAS